MGEKKKKKKRVFLIAKKKKVWEELHTEKGNMDFRLQAELGADKKKKIGDHKGGSKRNRCPAREEGAHAPTQKVQRNERTWKKKEGRKAGRDYFKKSLPLRAIGRRKKKTHQGGERTTDRKKGAKQESRGKKQMSQTAGRKQGVV